MMILLRNLLALVLLVCFLITSCKEEVPQRNFKTADYQQFADSLGFSIRAGDTSFLMRKLNFEGITERLKEKTNTSSLRHHDIHQLFKKELTSLVFSLTYRSDHSLFRYLHMEHIEDTCLMYFRSFRFKRIDYLVAKVVKGRQQLYLDDLALFSQGLSFEETLADIYSVAFVDNSILIPGNDDVSHWQESALLELSTIKNLVDRGMLDNAIKEIRNLPADLRGTKYVKIIEAQLEIELQDRDRAEVKVAGISNTSKFKGIHSLLYFKLFSLQKKHDKLLVEIEHLDSLVHDPLLSVFKSLANYELKNFTLAEQQMKNSLTTASNETRPFIYENLLNYYVLQSKKKEALEVATEMLEKSSFNKSDLAIIFMNNPALRFDPDVAEFLFVKPVFDRLDK